MMPFGHGIFAGVKTERPDLFDLWRQRIEHLLRRPLIEPHPFIEAIEQLYPWRNENYILDAPNPSQSS